MWLVYVGLHEAGETAGKSKEAGTELVVPWLHTTQDNGLRHSAPLEPFRLLEPQ